MKLNTRDIVTILRYTEGYYNDDGDWVQEDPYEEDLPCGIQPDFSGFKRYIEDSGIREEDCLVLRTPFIELCTTDTKNKISADKVIVDGLTYVVDRVEKWRGPYRLRHQKVLLRLDVDGEEVV
jgi:hypothetical protein|tara:strand:- start:225 stop:593 length:369 start_codon:yes stop_codon:yes gene_type:complete